MEILVTLTTWTCPGRLRENMAQPFHFDGADDFVNIADANSLDLTNGMTIEAWVNPGNLTGYKTAILQGKRDQQSGICPLAKQQHLGFANQRPNSAFGLVVPLPLLPVRANYRLIHGHISPALMTAVPSGFTSTVCRSQQLPLQEILQQLPDLCVSVAALLLLSISPGLLMR